MLQKEQPEVLKYKHFSFSYALLFNGELKIDRNGSPEGTAGHGKVAHNLVIFVAYVQCLHRNMPGEALGVDDFGKREAVIGIARQPILGNIFRQCISYARPQQSVRPVSYTHLRQHR